MYYIGKIAPVWISRETRFTWIRVIFSRQFYLYFSIHMRRFFLPVFFFIEPNLFFICSQAGFTKEGKITSLSIDLYLNAGWNNGISMIVSTDTCFCKIMFIRVYELYTINSYRYMYIEIICHTKYVSCFYLTKKTNLSFNTRIIVELFFIDTILLDGPWLEFTTFKIDMYVHIISWK